MEAIATGQCKKRSEIVLHIVGSVDTAVILQEALYVFGSDLEGMHFIGADEEALDPSIVELDDARTFATMYVLSMPRHLCVCVCFGAR